MVRLKCFSSKTNNKIPSSRWYSGSGIYRDVKLTVTDKVHVGYNGTKIIAKDLENTKDNNVKVDVTATIDNDSDTNKRSQLKILYWMLKEMPRVVPSLMKLN